MTREARRQPHQQLGDFIEHMGGGPGCTLSFDGVSTRPLDALADDIAVALAPAMRNLWAVGAETMVQPMRPIGELPMTSAALKGRHGGAAAGNVPTTQQHAKHARSLSLCRSCSIITAEETPRWSYAGKHAARVVVRISPPPTQRRHATFAFAHHFPSDMHIASVVRVAPSFLRLPCQKLQRSGGPRGAHGRRAFA